MSLSDDDGQIEQGTPGASARREHERRRAKREQRVRERYPRLGTIILALSNEPTHETAWARGAAGEEQVAQALATHLADGAVVLHDRRIPRSRANIDHIVIARSGVWVIDSKRYAGKVAVRKPLFGDERLTIAGRDKTALVDGLATQASLVEAVVHETAPEVPVRGALCFVEADLPLIGTLRCKGYPLVYPRALAKGINAGGTLGDDLVRALAGELATRFPVA